MEFGDALQKMIGLASGSKDPIALNAVMEVQRQLIAIQEENRILRNENNGLKNERNLNAILELKNSAYYKTGKDTPYCTRCYDVEEKLVTMSNYVALYSDTFTFACPNCKNEYDSGIKHGKDTSLDF